jgi:hypothetical protein
VYDDIMEKRAIPDVNNFWKAIANHPPTLRRTWSVRGRRPQAARSLTAAGRPVSHDIAAVHPVATLAACLSALPASS